MLDELKRKAEAATPGPWKKRKGFMTDTAEIYRPNKSISVGQPGELAVATDTDTAVGRANAAYIAAADPQTVLRLIAVAQAAKNVSDEVGEDYTDADWQCVWKAVSALREALQALETK